jgi:preprotein translocase subunit SecA
MRLFATGAISWVMDRTMPDDEPIEAKMVTKAIERAQNTVEGRNAEIRKDVLKYDEVMNEQRKVIYARRQQILEGDDLHDLALSLLTEKLGDVVASHCPSEFAEEWDPTALLLEANNYCPTTMTEADVLRCSDTEELHEALSTDAVTAYEAKCAGYPGGIETARAIERDVMLQIVDQRWRDHLSDMDHLRDGIHLRAMAQQDPLVAWQRDGYAMFESLLAAINDDFVRYITHIDAIVEPGSVEPAERGVTNIQSDVAESPVSAQPSATRSTTPANPNAKVGRNDPCPCGSGRKYKQCHGRP